MSHPDPSLRPLLTIVTLPFGLSRFLCCLFSVATGVVHSQRVMSSQAPVALVSPADSFYLFTQSKRRSLGSKERCGGIPKVSLLYPKENFDSFTHNLLAGFVASHVLHKSPRKWCQGVNFSRVTCPLDPPGWLGPQGTTAPSAHKLLPCQHSTRNLCSRQSNAKRPHWGAGIYRGSSLSYFAIDRQRYWDVLVGYRGILDASIVTIRDGLRPRLFLVPSV